MQSCVSCGEDGHTYLNCPKVPFFSLMGQAFGVPDLLGNAMPADELRENITQLNQKSEENELERAVRLIPILLRLRSCVDRISNMCVGSKPLQRSIPAQWYDDDVFILTTLRDADARIMDLIGELDAELRRTANFEACLDRALKLWQAAHPTLEFWPDAAINLAWVFDRLTALQDDYTRLVHNNTQLQHMAYNQGLEDGGPKQWRFLTEDPDSFPEDGQRVLVIYRHAGLEELIDAADYRSAEEWGGALWWHTDRNKNRAYDRSRDEILAWMPMPGVPFEVDNRRENEREV